MVPPDVEMLFEIRLLFILKSMEKMRESCTNSCRQWCSQVAPKIGTAGEESGSSVPQWQGQAGGEQKDTPVGPAISHSNPENEPDGLVQGSPAPLLAVQVDQSQHPSQVVLRTLLLSA